MMPINCNSVVDIISLRVKSFPSKFDPKWTFYHFTSAPVLLFGYILTVKKFFFRFKNPDAFKIVVKSTTAFFFTSHVRARASQLKL